MSKDTIPPNCVKRKFIYWWGLSIKLGVSLKNWFSHDVIVTSCVLWTRTVIIICKNVAGALGTMFLLIFYSGIMFRLYFEASI